MAVLHMLRSTFPRGRDLARCIEHNSLAPPLLILPTAAAGMLTMIDIVANHAGPIGSNYSMVNPFNKQEHYHDCSGCTEYCSIPQVAYTSADLWPPKRPEADLVKHCRLIDLADLNQSHPFVRQQLIKWMQDTLAKFPFDAVRMDTVKHVETVSAASLSVCMHASVMKLATLSVRCTWLR